MDVKSIRELLKENPYYYRGALNSAPTDWQNEAKDAIRYLLSERSKLNRKITRLEKRK